MRFDHWSETDERDYSRFIADIGESGCNTVDKCLHSPHNPFRATDPEGRPIAVSGVVIVPPGPVPEGGRRIVAWAHPTSGIVPRCAPSLAIFLFQQIQGSRELLQQTTGVKVTHISLFDGSNEGIACADRPAFAVQYHPEASPGPSDSHYLFHRFVEMIERHA